VVARGTSGAINLSDIVVAEDEIDVLGQKSGNAQML
jgi:hypothetical protein